MSGSKAKGGFLKYLENVRYPCGRPWRIVWQLHIGKPSGFNAAILGVPYYDDALRMYHYLYLSQDRLKSHLTIFNPFHGVAESMVIWHPIPVGMLQS